MNLWQKVWWIVLYTFIGVGLSLVFGAAFALDDPTTTFFTSIFTVAFFVFWAAVGIEIYKECSGKNDIDDTPML